MSGASLPWAPRASWPTYRSRARMKDRVREFFAARGLLEVDTPALISHPVPDAHIHSVGCQLSSQPGRQLALHTSPEYHMKRLLAAGAPDIFQICKVFRDDSNGARHAPEFTLIEWYRHDISLAQMIDETCDLITQVAATAGLTLPPAQRFAYRDLYLTHVGVDPLEADAAHISKTCHALLGDRLDTALAQTLAADADAGLDLLMVEIIAPQLAAVPLLVIDGYPAPQAALARLSPEDARVAERFEVFLAGVEIANGYAELTDLAEHRLRFAAALDRRRRLGLPLPTADPGLLMAVAAGIPPCCGVAVGFDRLVMASLGLRHLEEATGFPVPDSY